MLEIVSVGKYSVYLSHKAYDYLRQEFISFSCGVCLLRNSETQFKAKIRSCVQEGYATST